MERKFHHLTLRTSDPYSQGHICSLSDAHDLNTLHATRVRALLNERLGATPALEQHELDSVVQQLEQELQAGLPQPLAARPTYALPRKDLLREAQAEYEHQCQRLGTSPTQAQRLEALERLMATPQIVERARIRRIRAALERRNTIARLLGVEAEPDGPAGTTPPAAAGEEQPPRHPHQVE